MTNYATTPSKQYLRFHGFLRIPTTTNGERRLCVIDRSLFYFEFFRKRRHFISTKSKKETIR